MTKITYQNQCDNNGEDRYQQHRYVDIAILLKDVVDATSGGHQRKVPPINK
jgi:hypothetical protein